MTKEKVLANLKWIEEFKLANSLYEGRKKYINKLAVLREIALENTKELLKYIEGK